MRSKTEGLSVKALRRGEWWAGGEYLPLWGRGTAIAVDEEIIPYIALPFTRILNSSPNNAKANPFFSAHAAGANTFANSGKRSLATQVHKNAARELRPLDSAAVGGRLCDEFCCGDFCVCYSGRLFSVRTEVVSRMGLCGIW